MTTQVTLSEIRNALQSNDYDGLLALRARSIEAGIQGCDSDDKLTTLRLAISHCGKFQGASPEHTHTLSLMLDAIERGNHPYDDWQAMSYMRTTGAIAQAKLCASVGRRGK
jgi:hypothetical protein